MAEVLTYHAYPRWQVYVSRGKTPFSTCWRNSEHEFASAKTDSEVGVGGELALIATWCLHRASLYG